MTELLAAVLTMVLLSRIRVRPNPALRANATFSRAARRRPRWRRRANANPTELAAWCDALAREVRSGATVGAALRSIDPPPHSRLGEIGQRLHRGVPLPEAVAVSTTSTHEHAVLTVLGAIARAGGPAAQPLDRAAATLRRRAADDAERTAQSAQARLSAIVMTVLPGAVLVMLLATSGPVRSVTTSALGAGVVMLGLLLNMLGWLWMRRLVRGRSA